jgi:hypothetical protein
MTAKLKSRKFWATFAVGATVLFATQLGLSEDQAWQLVATLAAYVGAEGYVDAKRVTA